MDDLQATRLCAEAMGINPLDMPYCAQCDEYTQTWEPLENDAQAMALVKRFDLQIGKTLRTPESPRGEWFVSRTDKYEVSGSDLNRAIVYCVAKMQAGRGTASKHTQQEG